MFAPFGKIYDLDTYRGLLDMPQCIGAKHSSLSRELEWQRFNCATQLRPDFKVFTGNDLAIDMVMYGSDYLLGLSTFAPDLFARRDALWASRRSRVSTNSTTCCNIWASLRSAPLYRLTSTARRSF